MKKFLFFLVLLAASFSTFADGFIVVENPPWHLRTPPWPGPMPPPRFYEFAPLEVTWHHVRVKIDGQIATTSVDEDFYNPNPQRLEGTYLFPVPAGAQIDKFTMDIGGRQVPAELLPADKARSIYEGIVRKMRDPALLEYADRDVFRVRIYPIEPNGHKRITLSYTQVLKADAGLVSYVYPLNTEKFSASPVKDVSVQVELQSDRPLKTIYSPSHAVEIKRQGPNCATVGYEAADVLPDTDFALYFAPEPDELGVNLMAHKTGDDDGYFLLLASPGLGEKETDVMPKDVAFVLDTSGSMAGRKIEQAKQALQFCVASLNDNDRFQLIRFSTDVQPLFEKLVPASQGNRQKAADFIKDLEASGATAIDDALQAALALRPDDSARPFVVVFLTDGMPTIGTTDDGQIIADVKAAAKGRARIFCFGLGDDVNTHLLDQIAEETRAFAQYVLPEEDLELKVSTFFSKIKDPVLANPTIHFNGDVRVASLYPAPLPDLFRNDQLVLAGRYTGHGDASVVLEGTVNGAKRQFTYPVNFPNTDDKHEFIPRLWATRRVGYLLDQIRLHGENDELRDEVTRLARQFSIVTPYTAYLIVEDEDRRAVPLSLQSLPQLSADQAARNEAAGNWSSFLKDDQGETALAGARADLALRQAEVPAPAVASVQIEASRALGISAAGGPGQMPALPPMPANDAKARLANDSQPGRWVGGKNFFLNAGNQWVDSLVQQLQNPKPQRIQFGSPDYFAFAAGHPQALPWLALGRSVQFVLDGALYEIYE